VPGGGASETIFELGLSRYRFGQINNPEGDWANQRTGTLPAGGGHSETIFEPLCSLHDARKLLIVERSA